ncbi:MAG: sigma-54-dependent Fis family transcriptional regulator [Rhodocyclales bacterium GWA2_65_20]|nr:MAG: sigma-54-dependent Fis family transcriptional regulator [Rhodocyclales bacterium GWA2_65_20]
MEFHANHNFSSDCPVTDIAGKPSLLIVDDDQLIIDSLGFTLGRDFAVLTAASRTEAVDKLVTCAVAPALALIDLGLPPTPHRPDEGFALISELLARAPAIRIVVLSGQNDEANARHARALGAVDFVAKPASPEGLRALFQQILAYPSQAVSATAGEPELVGESLPLQRLRLQLRQYANSPFPVLIDGESGSGKEIVAASLHRLSQRSSQPYLALNCAAISPTLVEPTLFGHAKGAFTGAVGARAGYFEEAADGTLFLDEIGELPLDLQPKLLRVLENGAYQRVGETQGRVSRARVVAATNRDLKKEVREGRFRADLYHRLSVFSIAVPPLREMGKDRLLLLDHFRRHYAAQAGQAPFGLCAEAEARWLAYHFPGNVRELRNIAIRLATKYAGQDVAAAELEAELDTSFADVAELPVLHRDPLALIDLALAHLKEEGESFSLDDTLRNWESAYIEAAQRLTQGNVSHAAKLLGVNRTTLYNRMETLARSRGKT